MKRLAGKARALRGFTLVEVVLAIGITVFCLTALVGVLAVCINASKSGASTTNETLLFQKVVNQLRVASADITKAQAAGAPKSDIFPLPMIKASEEKTFTVDSLNRFWKEGAVVDGDARKVVNVKIFEPSATDLQNSPAIVKLANGGKVAFVRVSISDAAGYKKDVSPATVYFTEISLLTQ
jgi:Tfp pilus assembly protein PilV